MARGHHNKKYKRQHVKDSFGNIQLLMSSMEIDYYNYLTSSNITWSKPRLLKYLDNYGKEHTYRPDFYLNDTCEYIEIKGYWWNNDKIKMDLVIDQNSDLKIRIILRDELNKIIRDES